MFDIGLKFDAVPSLYPHPLTDLEVKVTDIELFYLMKCESMVGIVRLVRSW